MDSLSESRSQQGALGITTAVPVNAPYNPKRSALFAAFRYTPDVRRADNSAQLRRFVGVSAARSATASSGKSATTPTGSRTHWANNIMRPISSWPSPAATMQMAIRRSAAATRGFSATTTRRPTRPHWRNGRLPSPRPTPSSSPRSTCSRVPRESPRPSSTTSAEPRPTFSRRGSRSSTPARRVRGSNFPPVRSAPPSASISAKRKSSAPPMKIPSAPVPPRAVGRTAISSIPFPGVGPSMPPSPRFASL